MENRRMWIVNVKTEKRLEQISLELCGMLDPKYRMSGMLILEEVFTNVEKYAYEYLDAEPIMVVFLVTDEKKCILTFMDYGVEFDPTKYIPCEADGKSIGGHGIRIIKEYCSEMLYHRTRDGANLLEITL